VKTYTKEEKIAARASRKVAIAAMRAANKILFTPRKRRPWMSDEIAKLARRLTKLEEKVSRKLATSKGRSRKART
jgi:hypothetical protein